MTEGAFTERRTLEVLRKPATDIVAAVAVCGYNDNWLCGENANAVGRKLVAGVTESRGWAKQRKPGRRDGLQRKR